MTISISKLFLYPIKSCRGIPVSSAEITPLGFKYDRNYMLVEVKPPKADDNDGLKPETWVPMTLRQHPRMGLINTSIENGEIVVTAETSSERITLPLSPSSEYLSTLKTTPTMDLFGTNVRPRILPDQSKFFADFLSVPSAKIVYLGPDPRAIIINQPPSEAQNGAVITTAFADAGPYLLAAEESFKHVNDQLEKKLDIIRFRPNIVVKGTGKPWDEDDWKEISVGGAGRFYVIARCPRCQLPNVDLETGIKDPNQPYKTLSKYRRIDAGAKYSPCFGMLCVSDKLDGVLAVGDKVDVLGRGEHFFLG